MAVLKKHSYDDKKILRYEIGKRINIRNQKDMGSYFNAIGKGAIREYDGENIFYARIDPYISRLVGSFIENRRVVK